MSELHEEAARRWAVSVPVKELEANIIALQHQGDTPQPVLFKDAWLIDIPATVIVVEARKALARRVA